jgi:hypothetical protein
VEGCDSTLLLQGVAGPLVMSDSEEAIFMNIYDPRHCAIVVCLPQSFAAFIKSWARTSFSAPIKYWKYRKLWMKTFEKTFLDFERNFGLNIYKDVDRAGLRLIMSKSHSLLVLIGHVDQGFLDVSGDPVSLKELISWMSPTRKGIVELAGCNTEMYAELAKIQCPRCIFTGTCVEIWTDDVIIYYYVLFTALFKKRMNYYDSVVITNRTLREAQTLGSTS